MSNKICYFKCKYEGHLYNFPPLSYTSYEKFCKWKEVLRKEDKEKDVNFISTNFKFCKNHFEECYITAKNRLTRHAIPTLRLGTSLQQEELLCKFIEKNPSIITRYTSGQEIQDKMESEWKAIETRLNALGQERSHDEWAKYLFDVISSLKTKEVVWMNQSYAVSHATNAQVIRNKNDFTVLELKILELWNQRMNTEDSPDHFESDKEEYEIEMENVMEDEDSDNSETNRVSRVSRDNERTDEIVTFTLNVATGGLKPLLQAADIAPCEAPHRSKFNIMFDSTCSNSEMQDEFDAFGKYVAQQLKNMPIQTALDTRKLLISILRSKQSKILNDSFLEH